MQLLNNSHSSYMFLSTSTIKLNIAIHHNIDAHTLIYTLVTGTISMLCPLTSIKSEFDFPPNH